MTRYLVYEPPEAMGPSDTAVFLRDRFSFLAFFFTFLWMFRYGLWVSGLVTVALLVAINALGTVEGFELSAVLISMLLGVLIGLEGPSLRAAKLRRKGWNDVAAFEAQSSDEAELIYYHAFPEEALMLRAPNPAEDRAPSNDASDTNLEGSARAQSAEEDDRRLLDKPQAGAMGGPAGADDAAAPSSEARGKGKGESELTAELERALKVEGRAERWDKPGVETAKLAGGRRVPVGRL
ncbi:DUF2628 domain-containing protein [Jiella mangrovi]|uniref:DUF2628 domain-containing protein n=1 Tax=Jiella mangrovi TaxID=2821407 RepID=A0ABS4BNF9_9HYPH|nr:DUF2628 domain-containing protein [Jiella mangrovi]MBP0618052.1 DUF2628 domain-containing protein [Jiella mangrovi]